MARMTQEEMEDIRQALNACRFDEEEINDENKRYNTRVLAKETTVGTFRVKLNNEGTRETLIVLKGTLGEALLYLERAAKGIPAWGCVVYIEDEKGGKMGLDRCWFFPGGDYDVPPGFGIKTE